MKRTKSLGREAFSSFKKRVILLISMILLVGFIATVINNYTKKTSLKYQEQAKNDEKIDINQANQDLVSKEGENKEGDNTANQPESRTSHKDSELLKPLKSDFTIGDKNAPILFIEYASLSCPHCASFTREAFDKLKSDFIDTGKVLFIYRDFPLNHPALAAAMIAQCRASEAGLDHESASEKFYNSIKIIFRTQDSWAFDQKFLEKLETIFKLDGMSTESFKSCIANKKLQEKILQHRMQVSQSLALKSTPTFFVNGEAIDGYVDYKSIREIIEKNLVAAK